MNARTDEWTFELVHDDEPGRVVRGCVTPPPLAPGEEHAPRSLPCVLVLHGFKGFMDWGFFPELARRIAAAGCVAVRFNMSGSGVGRDRETISETEAFARNTPSREIGDAERVRVWVDEGGVPAADPSRVGIVGHSLGGGVALVHAAERGDYRALVGWAAVSTFVRFDDDTVSRWRSRGHVWIPNARTKQEHRLDRDWLDDVEARPDRLDPVRAAARLAAPALLVHGSADEAVPVAEGRALGAALAEGPGARGSRLEVVEGAGHTFGAHHPLAGVPAALERALGLTTEHLREHLGARS